MRKGSAPLLDLYSFVPYGFACIVILSDKEKMLCVAQAQSDQHQQLVVRHTGAACQEPDNYGATLNATVVFVFITRVVTAGGARGVVWG